MHKVFVVLTELAAVENGRNIRYWSVVNGYWNRIGMKVKLGWVGVRLMKKGVCFVDTFL